jgi:cytochrome b6-f complex iron-sulfur subunit
MAVGTGPGPGSNPDLSSPNNPPPNNPPPDLAMPSKPPPPSCNPGPLNAGNASAISTGSYKKVTSSFGEPIFVMRDAKGLYALSGSCTHAGKPISAQSSQFYCPYHGATFTLDGSVTGGPAGSDLPNYAVCIDSNGVAWVDPNSQVNEGTRV